MKIIFKIWLLLAGVLMTSYSQGQTTIPLYETIPDATEKKILKGLITEQQLSNDPDFGWYQTQLKYFRIDTNVVAAIAEKAYDVQLVIFLGTWCHDSQQTIPKYLSTLSAAEFPAHRLTLIAVDKQKQAVGNIQRFLNVTNVPTLLIFKNGKEVGRIVEAGNTGMPDKELGAILKAL